MALTLGALSCEAFDAGDRIEGSLPMDELFLRLAAKFSVFTEESSLESSRKYNVVPGRVLDFAPQAPGKEIIFEIEIETPNLTGIFLRKVVGQRSRERQLPQHFLGGP